jgi:ketosteroid isomerase-like protein
MRYVDETTFQLVLSDLFGQGRQDTLASIEPLRQHAFPTPVGIVTAWPVSTDEVQSKGFAFIVHKPFAIDDLLANVAASLNLPLEARQRHLAGIVTRYFDALSANDWDTLVNLCSPDVVYLLSGQSAFAGEIRGREAFRAYSEDVFSHFPSVRFEDINVYVRPKGLAARYMGSWLGPDGERPRMSGAVMFEFRDDLISQVGIRLNDERLRQLMALNQ